MRPNINYVHYGEKFRHKGFYTEALTLYNEAKLSGISSPYLYESMVKAYIALNEINMALRVTDEYLTNINPENETMLKCKERIMRIIDNTH